MYRSNLIFAGKLNFIITLLLFSIYAPAQSFTEYSKKEFSFNGISTLNQVKAVVNDDDGNYWFQMLPYGQIKWNGKHFIPVKQGQINYFPVGERLEILPTNSNKPLFRSLDRPLVYYRLNKGNKLDSIIVKHGFFDKRLGDVNYLRRGDDLLQCLHNANKKNTNSEIDSFYAALSRDDVYPQYRVSDNLLYLIRANKEVYVYSNGEINRIDFFKNTIIYLAWVINKNGVFFANNKFYKLSGKTLWKLNVAGRAAKKFAYDASHLMSVWSGLHSGDKYLLGQGNTIYSTELKGDTLFIEEIFKADPKQRFTTFFFNSKTNSFLLAKAQGGFQYYTPQFFGVNALHTSRLHYSVVKCGKKIISDASIVASMTTDSKKMSSYSFAGPVLAYNKYVYFCHIDGLYRLHPNSLKVLERYKLTNAFGQPYTLVATDSFLIIQTGRLYKLPYNSNSVKPFEPVNKGAIPGDYRFITQGNRNELFALADSSLYLLNYQSGFSKKLYSFTKDINFRSLYYDSSSRSLFVCTNGNGMFYYNLLSKKIVRLPLDPDKSLEYGHYLLKDIDGDWWIPTNNGLFLLSNEKLLAFLAGKLKDNLYYRFGGVYGITNEEFNGGFSNSGIAVGDSIFMANMDGILSFNSTMLKRNLRNGNSAISSPIVENIQIDNITCDEAALLKVNPEFKSIYLKVSYPYLNNDNTVLEYKIIGTRDKSWDKLPDDGGILIKELQPGKYTIVIRSNSNEELKISLKIIQFWYLRWWAILLYILLATGFLFLISNWYIQKRKAAALKSINLVRANLFSILAHDLRSPFKAYQGLSDVVSYALKVKDYKAVKEISIQLEETGNRLDLLINNLLNWSVAQQLKLKPVITEFDFEELYNNLLPLYNTLAQKRGIRIKTVMESCIGFVNTDQNLTALILRNMIDNAVKNAETGTIVFISLTKSENLIHFKIKNIVAQEKKSMLENLVKKINKSDWEPVKGLGLRFVTESLKSLKGNIYSSFDGAQSIEFLIKIPIASAKPHGA